MSTITEIYSEVLDLGRDKMTEGDYLKLATFLADLHKKNDEPPQSIFREDVLSSRTVIEFDTLKDKRYVINITEYRHVIYTGRKPNERLLSGTVNDEPFTNMLVNDFYKKWKHIIGFYGCKNIKRSSNGEGVEEFASFARFRKHCDELLALDADNSDSDDNGVYNDVRSYFEVLFGIDSAY
jgi:hypothetical protein